MSRHLLLPVLRLRQQLSRRGFTLMELAIGIVFMGILVAIAGTKFYKITSRVAVDDAAKTVAADLRQAVTIAQRGQKPVTLQLEGTNRYTVKDRATSPADTVRLRRNLAFARDQGARSVSFSVSTVTFYPQGITDQALTVTLTSDGYSRTVTLSAAGQVRIP